MYKGINTSGFTFTYMVIETNIQFEKIGCPYLSTTDYYEASVKEFVPSMFIIMFSSWNIGHNHVYAIRIYICAMGI